MSDSEIGSEEKFSSVSPENSKEQIDLRETEIDRLNDLEGILNNMDVSMFMAQGSENVDEEGRPIVGSSQAEKLIKLIKQGRDGKLKGISKAKRIQDALTQGIITEQDLIDRINNIDADLKALEEQLSSFKSDEQVSDLLKTVVDKYKNQDWPE